MGRAPCCEKVGLKKGPWTTEEDQILINYINQHGGHGNWRKLPKQAGLLRCGKSCRLRWINYLRPDIKRGNFTKEEEDIIIKLHQELGNKWSAVAARLPGRTDNEIKNVWNTHLKKRFVDQVHTPPKTKKRRTKRYKTNKDTQENTKPVKYSTMLQDSLKSSRNMPNSPSHSANETSSVNMAATDGTEFSRVGPSDLCGVRGVHFHTEVGQSNASDGSLTPDGTSASVISDTLNKLLEMEEDFCRSDVISGDYSSMTSDVQSKVDGFEFDSNMHDDDMEFWYNIYTRDGELAELLQEL